MEMEMAAERDVKKGEERRDDGKQQDRRTVSPEISSTV